MRTGVKTNKKLTRYRSSILLKIKLKSSQVPGLNLKCSVSWIFKLLTVDGADNVVWRGSQEICYTIHHNTEGVINNNTP